MLQKTKKRIHTTLRDRTRFGDIVSEFWAPAKPSRRAIIICDGCPSVPSKAALGEFLAKKGFWVFHMRYRGTWESGGQFLDHSPHEDILHVIARLNLGFDGLYTKEHYLLDIDDVTVIGTSFGGGAALIAGTSDMVNRVIAVAPVIDFAHIEKHSKVEKTKDFMHALLFGFEGAYRVLPRNILKLATGKYYNPISFVKSMRKEKVLIFHALDDKVVPVGALRAFAKTLRIKPVLVKEGGHFSSSILMQSEFWKVAKVHLKNSR